MLKKLLLAIFILLIYRSNQIINASDYRLVNEVNYMKIDNQSNSLEVGGWAFIMDAQHYINATSHEFRLILKSKTDSISVKGDIRNISQTSTMSYYGSPKCKADQIKVSALVCNHNYDNVGFKFNIPLDKLKPNSDYVATIEVNAKKAKMIRETPLYYANKESLTLSKDKLNYIVDSKLYNSKVKVINSSVIARLEAKKESASIASASSCSNAKVSHFKVNSVFNSIFDKKMQGNNTYYQLKGKYDTCLNKISQIVEGNQISSIWIASNFVEQLGESLTIKVKLNNSKPTIKITDHPTIYVGETFELRKGVTAYDYEDGDLTYDIKVESNNFKNQAGLYEVVFVVKDSDNNMARASKFISVLARNYPPVILARDVKLSQYDPYNPMDYVSASDQDQTDISSLINFEFNIDTGLVGTFRQCYNVKDKYNLSDRKCSSVIIEELEKDFRFIQMSNPFYKEDWPKIWKPKQDILKNQVENKIIYQELQLSK